MNRLMYYLARECEYVAGRWLDWAVTFGVVAGIVIGMALVIYVVAKVWLVMVVPMVEQACPTCTGVLAMILMAVRWWRS